jgi:hypothetical protein
MLPQETRQSGGKLPRHSDVPLEQGIVYSANTTQCHFQQARGGAVAWGTTLQAEEYRVRFPMNGTVRCYGFWRSSYIFGQNTIQHTTYWNIMTSYSEHGGRPINRRNDMRRWEITSVCWTMDHDDGHLRKLIVLIVLPYLSDNNLQYVYGYGVTMTSCHTCLEWNTVRVSNNSNKRLKKMVLLDFYWHNPSGRSMALRSTQSPGPWDPRHSGTQAT